MFLVTCMQVKSETFFPLLLLSFPPSQLKFLRNQRFSGLKFKSKSINGVINNGLIKNDLMFTFL